MKINLLEKYLRYTDESEAPEMYHRWCYFSMLGHIFERRVWLDMGYFRLYPGQTYTFLVGPPAIKKSSAIKVATGFLKDMGGVRFSAGKLSVQALINSMESQPVINGTQITHSDSTIFIKASELSVFIPKQSYVEEIIPFLTDAFDAEDTFEYDTIARGKVTLRNVLVTFLAGSTADWLFNNIPDSAWGGGFMSRVLLIHVTSCSRENAIPTISPGLRRLHQEILAELIVLGNELQGEFLWTKEARAWYTAWYSRFKKFSAQNIGNTISAYYARKPIHLLKIAMALAITQNRALVMTQHTLESAELMFEEMEVELPGLLDKKVIPNVMAEQCQKVLDLITSKGQVGGVKRSEILKALWRHGLNASATDLVLDTLLQAELVEIQLIGKAQYYRLR